MATLRDVRRLAMRMPAASERASGDGTAAWRVKDRLFVWERPLRKADLTFLGGAAPTGTVIGVRVVDEGDKEALVKQGMPYFTTPHFDGYPIVLVELKNIDKAGLEELIVDAWLDRAPPRIRKDYLDSH